MKLAKENLLKEIWSIVLLRHRDKGIMSLFIALFKPALFYVRVFL